MKRKRSAHRAQTTARPDLHLVLPPVDDPLAKILAQASLLLLKHPVAAQALFSAFVAEGREFAQTSEGKAWKEALVDSELVRRGRIFWEDSPLNVLEDAPDTMIPSAILDAVVQAASRVDVHSLLERLFDAPPIEGDEHDS